MCKILKNKIESRRLSIRVAEKAPRLRMLLLEGWSWHPSTHNERVTPNTKAVNSALTWVEIDH